MHSQRTVNARDKTRANKPLARSFIYHEDETSCQKLCECVMLGSTFCGEIPVEGLQALLGSTLEKHLTFLFLLIISPKFSKTSIQYYLEPAPDLHLAQRGQPTLPTQVTGT